jgi:hypothetical protein
MKKPTQEEIDKVREWNKHQQQIRVEKEREESHKKLDLEIEKIKSIVGSTIVKVEVKDDKYYKSFPDILEINIEFNDGLIIVWEKGQYGSDSTIRITKGKDYIFYG